MIAERTTPAEQRVLDLVAEGKSDREICAALALSQHTVRFHLRALMNKTRATNRTSLVLAAMRAGWVPVPVKENEAS